MNDDQNLGPIFQDYLIWVGWGGNIEYQSVTAFSTSEKGVDFSWQQQLEMMMSFFTSSLKVCQTRVHQLRGWVKLFSKKGVFHSVLEKMSKYDICPNHTMKNADGHTNMNESFHSRFNSFGTTDL